MDVFADTRTGMEILYQGRSLDDVLFDTDTANVYNAVAQELDLHPLATDPDWSLDFDIPAHYREIDVKKLLRELANKNGPEAMKRVEMELELYSARNLFPVLQLMIYIVETMRKNNVVWGVGRGSSVASYCLYLLGVHKVNSLKYNLDIHEFLK